MASPLARADRQPSGRPSPLAALPHRTTQPRRDMLVPIVIIVGDSDMTIECYLGPGKARCCARGLLAANRKHRSHHSASTTTKLSGTM